MNVVYFGDQKYAPDGLRDPKSLNKALIFIPTNYLLKNSNKAKVQETEEAHFIEVKAGSNFVFLKDNTNKYYAFGENDSGQLLMPPTSGTNIHKRLRKIRFLYKKDRIPISEIIVGHNNVIALDCNHSSKPRSEETLWMGTFWRRTTRRYPR